MESDSCDLSMSKHKTRKLRSSALKNFDPEIGTETNKMDRIKKEADESTDDEDSFEYKNNTKDTNYERTCVKSECDDSTEIVDHSCITSSESTVEQFDQLDVNTDDYVDSSELLISEVRKRPLLYDLSLEDYNDRNKKAKCWEEVYKVMIMNWSELSSAEKNNRGRIIQKRWRSIRDSFMKAYKKMNKAGNKKSSVKGKRYVYFDQMMFIIPTIEKRKNNGRYYQEEILPATQVECSIEEENTDDLSTCDLNILDTGNTKTPARKRQKKDCYESELIELLTQLQQRMCKPQENDEDKMFLLSLLPSLKKMNQDTKFACRIEILQIIRQALQTNSFPNASTTQTTSQSSCQQQGFPVTNGQQTVTQTWPSCQQNSNPTNFPSWPTNTQAHTTPNVDSHLLDLYD